MKKIIILFTFIFLTTGCLDYVELNDLNIISGISIDYENDLYTVAFEILNDKKEGQDSTKQTAIIIEDSGKTLSEAIFNTSKKAPKKPYFSHLKCLVISENVAKEKLENIIDYFLRNPDIRNEFNTVIAKDIKAKDLLSNSNKDNPVVSDLIETMLKNNEYYKNNSVTNPFEEMVTDILLFGIDTKMAAISIENDILNVSGIGVFKDYNLQGILTPQESITYNVLTGKSVNATYTYPCGNEFITLGIYNSDPQISVKNKKVEINATLEASIIESNCDYDLKKVETYDLLNKEYKKLFKKDIENFLNTLKKYDSDALGISRTYYIDSRKKDANVWKNAYKINVDLKINKKGLIFEVNNNDN